MSGRATGADPCPISPDGWSPGARALPSPHRDARPPGTVIELLVVHCISLPPGRFGGGHIERFFMGTLGADEHPYFERLRGVRVSAHFLVARDGLLTQFVSCLDRAWHAGASAWEGRSACNDFSIGVELEGSEFEPFTRPQYDALAALQRGLRSAYPIRATRGHSEIAPGRKTDPGPLFDWSLVVRDH